MRRTYLRRACSQNDHVCFAFCRDLQDAIRRVSKLQHQLRVVLQLGILGNQFLQAMATLLDRSRLTSQLRVILDDMHQDKASMKLRRDREGILSSEGGITGEICREQNLPQFQFWRGKIAPAAGEVG